MVVGIIVGASIFVQPSEILRNVPNARGVLLAWAAAGLLTLFGALVCAELSSVFPRTGGVYVFLHQTISPACAFLWGWAMFWSMHSGIVAASAVILARYIAVFFPMSDAAVRAAAIASIVLLSILNYFGARQGSVFQTTVTAAKILGIAAMLALIVAYGSPAARAHTLAPLAPISARPLILAIGAGLFAFGGWHMVTYTAGETRHAETTIPRALLLGVVIVTLAYIALNAAYLYLLPLHRAMSSTHIAADAAAALAGTRGALAVSALVIVSALGVLNGVILAGPRTYLAMAQDGLAFRWLAAIHPRFHTPYAAIAAQAVWCSVLVATGTYRALFSRVIYTEWLFFAVMAVGLMRHRRRASSPPPWRAWGYPVTPVLFIAASVTVAVMQMTADPAQAGIGMLLVALGLPVYYFWSHAHH